MSAKPALVWENEPHKTTLNRVQCEVLGLVFTQKVVRLCEAGDTPSPLDLQLALLPHSLGSWSRGLDVNWSPRTGGFGSIVRDELNGYIERIAFQAIIGAAGYPEEAAIWRQEAVAQELAHVFDGIAQVHDLANDMRLLNR